MNVALGREKYYYTNIIVLVLTLLLTRLLKKKYEEEVDKNVVFHFINWELKGQHSTNSFY